jgi:hypothetical protein
MTLRSLFDLAGLGVTDAPLLKVGGVGGLAGVSKVLPPRNRTNPARSSVATVAVMTNDDLAFDAMGSFE